MPYSIEVTVIEIKPDFGPYGDEYVQVSFGYKLPVPVPPQPQSQQSIPQPTPVFYKHALHLFLPKDQWRAQYTMWQSYILNVSDDGKVELKKVQY